VAEVVAYTLATVTFILKVDSSVQRPLRRLRTSLQISLQRRQRSRPFRLHRTIAQDVRVLRSLLGQRVSDVEVVHLPGLEVTL
jgi:2'-5' RNA ligase